MNKFVLLVGFDPSVNSELTEKVIIKTIQNGQTPILPVIVHGTIKSSTKSHIENANRRLVYNADEILVNDDYESYATTFAFCDLIGFAVLQRKKIRLYNAYSQKGAING